MPDAFIEAQMAQAFPHDDIQCQQDPQANAAWLEWGGEALDAFETACTRLANVCGISADKASLVMLGTLWDRWNLLTSSKNPYPATDRPWQC